MLIRSEHDAMAFLLQCWRDPSFGNDEPLTFIDCAMRIKLDPGNGTADERAHRAIALFREQFYRTYLLLTRGSPYGRVSLYDKQRLGLEHAVIKGSTEHIVETATAFGIIYKMLSPHWSTRMKNIVGAGMVASILTLPFAPEIREYATATYAARVHADSTERASAKASEDAVRIASIEASERLATRIIQAKAGGSMGQQGDMVGFPVADAKTADEMFVLASLSKEDPSGLVAFGISDCVPWRPALMDLAPKCGVVQWNGSAPIPSPVAKAYAKSARKSATGERLKAKAAGHPGMIETPWATEILRSRAVPGAMMIGLSDA